MWRTHKETSPNCNVTNTFTNPFEKYQRAVETFSKGLGFLGTSISRSLSQSWQRPVRPFPLLEVGTKSEKPQAPAALSELARITGKGVPSPIFLLQLPELSDRSSKIWQSCLRNKSYFGDEDLGLH